MKGDIKKVDKVRVVFIILAVIWMIMVFKFSSEAKTTSENTSSSVTKRIVKVIYGENNNFEENVKKLDPIIRKLAHYTLYLIRRNIN